MQQIVFPSQSASKTCPPSINTVCGLLLTRIHEFAAKSRKWGETFLLIPPPQFTNSSARLAESICGKCKVSQLPSDLAARVKVGDVYKMVCILPAWEIKRLAKNGFRPGLPTGGRVALFPVCCAEKRVHEPCTTGATGKQWCTKVCVSNTRVMWHLAKSERLRPSPCWNCLCSVSSRAAFTAIMAKRRMKKKTVVQYC